MRPVFAHLEGTVPESLLLTPDFQITHGAGEMWVLCPTSSTLEIADTLPRLPIDPRRFIGHGIILEVDRQHLYCIGNRLERVRLPDFEVLVYEDVDMGSGGGNLAVDANGELFAAWENAGIDWFGADGRVKGDSGMLRTGECSWEGPEDSQTCPPFWECDTRYVDVTTSKIVVSMTYNLEGEGYQRVDVYTRDGRFLGPLSGLLPSSELWVKATHFDLRGRLWIQDAQGLFAYDENLVPIGRLPLQGLPGVQVSASPPAQLLGIDRFDRLWFIATDTAGKSSYCCYSVSGL